MGAQLVDERKTALLMQVGALCAHGFSKRSLESEKDHYLGVSIRRKLASSLPKPSLQSCRSTIEVLDSTFSGSTTCEKRIHIEVGGSLALSNTVLTNSFSGHNCVGEPVLDAGYNMDSGASCRFTQATGSLSNTNPLLDPAGLQDNGGLVALQPDSPAVDLVGEGACLPPQLTR